jgi:hypothetical protein
LVEAHTVHAGAQPAARATKLEPAREHVYTC